MFREDYPLTQRFCVCTDPPGGPTHTWVVLSGFGLWAGGLGAKFLVGRRWREGEGMMGSSAFGGG